MIEVMQVKSPGILRQVDGIQIPNNLLHQTVAMEVAHAGVHARKPGAGRDVLGLTLVKLLPQNRQSLLGDEVNSSD